MSGTRMSIEKSRYVADPDDQGNVLRPRADGSMPAALVGAENITTKFREAFETYTPGERWFETRNGSGDLILLEGNAAAASYLTISKDPLAQDTTTTLDSLATFGMPFEMAVGLHTSQRAYGQELSVEMISTEAAVTAPVDLAISSIQQATTTLTVSTATAHGLRPGMRIGIRGVTQDSRLNYPALVVASTPSATQFTATSGPQGTIGTLTVGPFTSGYVYVRPAMSLAQNGTSMMLENATATNASFYIRSEAGDVLPSGTIIGNHSTTILTTASVQAINAALTYAFQPTDEFRLVQMVDSVQWSDVAVDSTGQPNSRRKVTQVVPNITVGYRLRFRAKNLPSLTVPVAKIVSAAKTGTTTATVTTDVAHGLTTGDYVQCYGNRDTTNFANLTTAAVVASVVNATTFTVVWGSAVTATGYGGFVARQNGQQGIQGVATMVAQSIARTSGIVAVVGSAAWSGFSIGDLVNLHGARNAIGGGDIGLDGAYRVRDIQTTTLYLEPIGNTATGGDIGSVNCGGAIIRRTDLRISYVRILDFDRLRIENLPRPAGDSSQAVPVVANGGSLTASVSSVAAGTNAIGDVGVQYRASATGGASAVSILSPATPAGGSIKGSAGRLLGLALSNSAAALRSVKIFNATSVTMGTTSALFEIDLAAGQTVVLGLEGGVGFATGIMWAVTAAKGLTDNTATGLATNDVSGVAFFA